MIFVKNSMGGWEVNMINTVSKINLSKIGWKGGRSTSIWIMSLNILFFLEITPKSNLRTSSFCGFVVGRLGTCHTFRGNVKKKQYI